MQTSLNQIKNNMINKVIDNLSNIKYMNDTEKNLYINELKSKLNNKLLVTNVRKQTGRTDAYEYNQTAFEIYLDLLTTFDYIDTLYSTINNHEKLNQSVINTLQSTIAILNDKLEECESVIGITGSPLCYIEGFKTQNNQEWDPKYYTERYGELAPLSTYVKFNPDQENITLNYTRQQNVIVYKSGVQLGEIDIVKQYGSGFITAKNSETKLENAIDTSNSSYWSETILSDAELKIVGLGFDNSSGEIGKYNRSYYNTQRGALCEIQITFEAMTKINEIILKPFGTFPIDIVAIRYQLSDDEDDDTYDIVFPDCPQEHLKSISINKEHCFHFKDINCKKLFILINQIHCIKDTYMISSNQLFKNELWFNSTYPTNKKALMENTSVFQPCYIDRSQEDNTWKYINNKLITNKHLDINNILINGDNKMLPVTKYQYNYGFYNIAPNFVEFQKTGIWVSTEIPVDGPIDTIRISSEEEHYIDRDGYISTDIEFYVTNKRNPSYNDWLPICPKNKNYVNRELVQLDYDYCYLRHKAVCGNKQVYDENGNSRIVMERPIVYYNDIILTEDADYILRYDDNGDVKAIEVANIDHFALYTVSYTPIDAAKEVSLVTDDNPIPSNTVEEIAGNGSACYELEDYPYYDRTDPLKTTSFVKIIDINTNDILIQTNLDDSPIKCVTNKTNPENSYKNFVAKSGKIQYYTYGKHVYFSEPIGLNQKIEISYPALSSKIRVKAILRRNTKKDLWITPVLKKFNLEFTTL